MFSRVEKLGLLALGRGNDETLLWMGEKCSSGHCRHKVSNETSNEHCRFKTSNE